MKLRWLAVAGIACAVLGADFKSEDKRWWSHIVYLADDTLEGRNTGSEGYQKAATYVAGEFERSGLKPAGVSGYMQPVKFHSRKIVEDQCSLALVRGGRTEPLVLGEDATIGLRVDPAESVEAPLAFVGYGLTVPEMHIDDLAGQNLKGKIAVYVSGGPASIPGPLSSHYQSAAERGGFLERAGVIGVVVIINPLGMDIPWERSSLARFQPSMSLAYSELDESFGQRIAVTINPAHADKILAGSGHTAEEILALAKERKPLPTFSLPASLRARTKVERSEAESPNVVGLLPGSDPKLKNEYVVLSAHLDHIGVGRPIKGDSINNGAMDDASGVATMLEIAQRLHESKIRLRRSLLFTIVTGEEKGLLGSRYYATHPTVKPENIVADLNVDMFLPLFPLHSLIVLGLDESDLGKTVRAVVEPLGVKAQPDLEPQRNVFVRSDQYSFIRQGVPALAFKVGYLPGTPEEAIVKKWLTERYHAPSDDLNQPVDLQAAGEFNGLILRIAEAVANQTERPRWNDDSFFRRFAH
jgi:Zn-dependent M28 family amino/carboxypeptidase